VLEQAADRIGQTAALDLPVSRLKGAGGRRLEGLARLGIRTIRDLLTDYPFRYNDFSQVVPVTSTRIGERANVLGTVVEVKLKRPRPRLTVVEASVHDGTALLVASWFNQPWLQKALEEGTRVILQGKVEHSFGFRRMASPLHTVLPPEAGEKDGGGIMPVYRMNSDIGQGWVSRLVDEALAALPAPLDPLPPALRIRHGLMSRHAALRLVHHPPDAECLGRARRRLAFEEVLLLQLSLLLRRRRRAARFAARTHVTDGPALHALKAAFPFSLTADQEKATAEILRDMQRPETMQRLLLGDVGSGKTAVAALALAAAHDSGTQAAMMAPTEVLALQYADRLGPLLDAAGVPWALLTSSTKASERARTLDALADGTVGVLFGTHALIEPEVVFCDLSLAVIDEQHRFGVAQRQALCAKGEGSDLLSMTATPIPRSLALTLYGDMETSFLRSRPNEGVRTVTMVIGKGERRVAYEAVREALGRKEQAYIVCPLISVPEPAAQDAADGGRGGTEARGRGAGPASHAADADGEGEEDGPELITEFSEEQDEGHIQAAEQEVRFLRAKVFPGHSIGLMTSRLTGAEKRRVMDEFRAGGIEVLVSTTVVEVGVDVPNATVMVIEDADRFGLSQLHQLRGRVGRGGRDGQVFLVSGAHGEDARRRLAIMERSSDGLKLAEHDLMLRREGDILGRRQHGRAPLKLVNVMRDAELIAQAHREAQGLLADDPLLQDAAHRHLASELVLLYGDEDGDDGGEGRGRGGPAAAGGDTAKEDAP
jgi:ATP-dependent DNA helicase RecG